MSVIIDNLESDLVEYLRRPTDQIEELKNKCREDAKIKWLASPPTTGVAANRFYVNAGHCPAQYTAWVQRDKTVREWPEFLASHYQAREWTKVLDYGAGISTMPLVMSEMGCGGIELADFPCPAFYFAQWKAWKYNLHLQYKYFRPDLEVQPVRDDYDCIICSHVIGHSFDPYTMLAYILSHGRYVFWCSDFRTTEDPAENLYPQHRRKPPMWDKILARSAKRTGNWLLASKVFGHNVNDLSAAWIAESGWTSEFND